MSAKSEYDAAYFTLLRALEERDSLLRYREFLESERARLDAFTEETRNREEPLGRKLRRPIEATSKPLLEAVGRRRTIVLEELRRMDDRVRNAEAFVAECEAEVATLRR